MNEATARDEICRIGKSLFDRGYVHASAGNISVRLGGDEGYLITPTDACLGYLDPAQLARLDANGVQLGGDRASKTLTLHRHIYRATSTFAQAPHCVVHTHSTYCVALTLMPHGEELLPPITPYFVMKVGRVPVIRYHRPGDPRQAEQVAATIAVHAEAGRCLRAVMLERLGPNVWGETPAAAMATLEELEETARLYVLTKPPPVALDAGQLDELRQQFGTAW